MTDGDWNNTLKGLNDCNVIEIETMGGNTVTATAGDIRRALDGIYPAAITHEAVVNDEEFDNPNSLDRNDLLDICFDAQFVAFSH